MNTHNLLPTRRALTGKTLIGLACLGAVATVRADGTWVGDTNQDWNNAANWSGDVAPTGNFFINTASGNFPVMSANSAYTPVDVMIGDGAGNSGRLDLTAGALSLANTSNVGNWFFNGRGGGSAELNVTGSASLNVGKLFGGGAFFNDNGTATITINTTGAVTANSNQDFSGWGQQASSVILGWGATGNGTLNLQAGTLNANGGMFVGGWGGVGTLNQTGGTLNAANLSVARWFGTGTANLTNATVNSAGAVVVAHSGAANDLTNGTLNVNNGTTLNVGGDLIAAFAGNNVSSGQINIAAGATVNVGTTSERWVVVNQWDTIGGALNIDGGTLNLNANTDLRFSTGNGVGASVVNMNGGAITAWGGNLEGAATSSVVDLNRAGGAAASNTFNLNGGTLTINEIITTADAGSANFNFNGGTLKAAGDSTNFVALGGANQVALVLGGGAVIDSNGFSVTIAEALTDGGGNGGLTKRGLGMLSLTGSNSFTGNVTIEGGTLSVNSAFIADTATVELFGGSVFNLDFVGTDVVNAVILASTNLGNGTYGAFGSGAMFESAFFTGTGLLQVGAIPEPSTWAAIAGLSALAFVAIRRRRS